MFGIDNFDTAFLGDNKNVINVDGQQSFEKKQNLDMSGSAVYTLKIGNQFSHIELELIQNDCLNLFVFLDENPFSDLQYNYGKNLIKMLFDKDEKTTIMNSFNSFLKTEKTAMMVINNDIGSTKDNIYVKLFCPFYSIYSHKKLIFHFQEVPKEYESVKEFIDLNDAHKTLDNVVEAIKSQKVENNLMSESEETQRVTLYKCFNLID